MTELELLELLETLGRELWSKYGRQAGKDYPYTVTIHIQSHALIVRDVHDNIVEEVEL